MTAGTRKKRTTAGKKMMIGTKNKPNTAAQGGHRGAGNRPSMCLAIQGESPTRGKCAPTVTVYPALILPQIFVQIMIQKRLDICAKRR